MCNSTNRILSASIVSYILKMFHPETSLSSSPQYFLSPFTTSSVAPQWKQSPSSSQRTPTFPISSLNAPKTLPPYPSLFRRFPRHLVIRVNRYLFPRLRHPGRRGLTWWTRPAVDQWHCGVCGFSQRRQRTTGLLKNATSSPSRMSCVEHGQIQQCVLLSPSNPTWWRDFEIKGFKGSLYWWKFNYCLHWMSSSC